MEAKDVGDVVVSASTCVGGEDHWIGKKLPLDIVASELHSRRLDHLIALVNLLL